MQRFVKLICDQIQKIGFLFLIFSTFLEKEEGTPKFTNQLWKWTEDGKLLNKAVGSKWQNGANIWSRDTHHFIRKESGECLSISMDTENQEDYEIWKLKDGKLINKALGQEWKLGSYNWVEEEGFLTDQATKEVLAIKRNKEWDIKPSCCRFLNRYIL